LVQEHGKGHPDINKMGVPLAVDFAKRPENRRVMELIFMRPPFLAGPSPQADTTTRALRLEG
jgi:hypothetical protein